MSIVKDAERLGDYGKNVFDLAGLAPRQLGGQHRERFQQISEDNLALVAKCSDAIDRRDKELAANVIVKAKQIEDVCDETVDALVLAPSGDIDTPKTKQPIDQPVRGFRSAARTS